MTHIGGLTELGGENLIAPRPAFSFMDRVYAMDTTRVTRLLDFEVFSGKSFEPSQNINFGSIEEAFRICETEFSRFTELIGAKVAPHVFGIIPIDTVQEVIKNTGSTDLANDLTRKVRGIERNPQLVPKGYIPAAEVAVIVPTQQSDTSSPDLGFQNSFWNEYYYYLRKTAEAGGKFALSDVADQEQYVRGYIMGDKADRNEELYLVDLDPLFEEV